MKRVTIEKRTGETPLQATERLRYSMPRLMNEKLAYAGRLDPMASGALLILVGEECKYHHTHYNKLDKEYTFDILLGMESDTGDVLGHINPCAMPEHLSDADIHATAHSFVGSRDVPYPAFSAKRVAGKPLFQYAHEGTTDSIEWPTTTMRIHRLQYEGRSELPFSEVLNDVNAKIGQLHVDNAQGGNSFRKDSVVARWHELRGVSRERNVLLHFRAVVGAGTYIRTLAPLIAQSLGTCGLAYHIHRVQLGRVRRVPLAGSWWRPRYYPRRDI
jgi:tRNA pseudouridine(55) synthase